MNHPAWFTRELYADDFGADVIAVQRLVDAPKTGVMDDATLARIRGARQALGREIVGVVDQALAVALGEVSTHGLVPVWFERQDWSRLTALLHCNCVTETAIRRFQSHHHIPPTGVVDEQTAIALGD